MTVLTDSDPTLAHYVARGLLLTVPNAYLAKEVVVAGGLLNYWTASGYLMRSVVVVVVPTAVVCSLGAIECTAYSIVNLLIGRNASASCHKNGALAFLHGALFFPGGYALVMTQMRYRAFPTRINQRMLINCVTLQAFYGIVHSGAKTFKYSCRGAYRIAKISYQVLDAVYVIPAAKSVIKTSWNITAAITTYAATITSTALGTLLNAAQSVLHLNK